MRGPKRSDFSSSPYRRNKIENLRFLARAKADRNPRPDCAAANRIFQSSDNFICSALIAVKYASGRTSKIPRAKADPPCSPPVLTQAINSNRIQLLHPLGGRLLHL